MSHGAFVIAGFDEFHNVEGFAATAAPCAVGAGKEVRFQLTEFGDCVLQGGVALFGFRGKKFKRKRGLSGIENFADFPHGFVFS